MAQIIIEEAGYKQKYGPWKGWKSWPLVSMTIAVISWPPKMQQNFAYQVIDWCILRKKFYVIFLHLVSESGYKQTNWSSLNKGSLPLINNKPFYCNLPLNPLTFDQNCIYIQWNLTNEFTMNCMPMEYFIACFDFHIAKACWPPQLAGWGQALWFHLRLSGNEWPFEAPLTARDGGWVVGDYSICPGP